MRSFALAPRKFLMDGREARKITLSYLVISDMVPDSWIYSLILIKFQIILLDSGILWSNWECSIFYVVYHDSKTNTSLVHSRILILHKTNTLLVEYCIYGASKSHGICLSLSILLDGIMIISRMTGSWSWTWSWTCHDILDMNDFFKNNKCLTELFCFYWKWSWS